MARQSREERAERRDQERSEIESIQQSFHVDVDDMVSKIKNKARPSAYGTSPGQNQFIDKDPYSLANAKGANPEHIDWDTGFLAKLGYRGQAAQGAPTTTTASYNGPNRISLAVADRMTSRAIQSFGPVMRELSSFKFSSEDGERNEQVEYVASVVKNALHNLAKKEVAANTQQVYKNLVKYSYSDQGITAVFKVSDVHVAIKVNGDFTGSEIVCCEVDGTDVNAEIVRQVGDEFPVVSGEYQVNLQVVNE